MKILVIGCGQCGGRIANELAKLNARAVLRRHITIMTGVFAVNTDVTDLTALPNIRPDSQHRILIGNRRTGGHGVGKINELGAEIAREDSDKVIDAIKNARWFSETDAFLLIASAAGGTGSGAIPVLTQRIKEAFPEKPAYNLVILPFQHEEIIEGRTIYNTGTCLKSTYLVADAVFLVDNQRFVKDTNSIATNMAYINSQIVAPFYDLLCAGEERNPKYIGGKIVDAGDIIQTLAGWTAIGHGQAEAIGSIPLLGGHLSFHVKSLETNRGIQAMQTALNSLSLKVTPSDAKRGLYLLSAPARQMNMEIVRSIGTALRNSATDAVIRSGDYPRRDNTVHVTVVLSELANVAKIMEYFTKTIDYLNITRHRRGSFAYDRKNTESIFRDIPSLLP